MGKLAVLFGGIGYHCDKPLLYYAREVACDKGYTECIKIGYQISLCDRKDFRRGAAELFVQVEEQLAQIDWEKYDEILFISKSIGTVVASMYVEKHAEIFAGKILKNVYLTPLELTFEHMPREGIAFVGDKDPNVETDTIIQKCKAQGIELQVIPGTNHSLESGDVWRNMDILKEVMREIAEYV